MECITCKHEMTHLTEDLYQCDECELVSSSIAPDLSIYDRSYEIKYDRYERTAAGSCIQNLRAECVWRHVFAGAWIKSPRLAMTVSLQGKRKCSLKWAIRNNSGQVY